MEEPVGFRYDTSLYVSAAANFWTDEPSQKDKAFRRYASSVDRSLSLFETTLQEWADYISFLSRLLKVSIAIS